MWMQPNDVINRTNTSHKSPAIMALRFSLLVQLVCHLRMNPSDRTAQWWWKGFTSLLVLLGNTNQSKMSPARQRIYWPVLDHMYHGSELPVALVGCVCWWQRWVHAWLLGCPCQWCHQEKSHSNQVHTSDEPPVGVGAKSKSHKPANLLSNMHHCQSTHSKTAAWLP